MLYKQNKPLTTKFIPAMTLVALEINLNFAGHARKRPLRESSDVGSKFLQNKKKLLIPNGTKSFFGCTGRTDANDLSGCGAQKLHFLAVREGSF